VQILCCIALANYQFVYAEELSLDAFQKFEHPSANQTVD